MGTWMLKFVTGIAGLFATANAHDHGGMNANAPLNDESTHCPICNMDVVKDWYLQMAHGQRIYSCSMSDGSQFKMGARGFSHASLVGATMKDISSNLSCGDTCPDCAAGTVIDPISGDVVPTVNFKYLCLNRGQKLYFASDTTKEQFVQGMATKPYFAVEKAICGGQPCADSFQLPVPIQDEPTPQAPPFCTGSSVMFSGFQSTVDGTCIKLFFQSWVLDTPLKYCLGVFGVFVLPLVNERLVVFREDLRMHYIKTKLPSRYQGGWTKHTRKLALTGLYMIQMTLAYLAMLVVMVYDSVLFLALIAGFGFAFAIFKSERSLGLKSTAMMRATWRFDESDFLTVLSVEGMMCMQNCGSTVQSALEKVPGVKQVYVGFSEKCAYVSGSAPTVALVDAVEAVGFEARVLRRPRAESDGAPAYGSNSHLA